MIRDAFARDNGIAEDVPNDAEKISRVAAFIVSTHGANAISHAQRLETGAAALDIARSVRMEVERLVQASASTGEMHSALAGLLESSG